MKSFRIQRLIPTLLLLVILQACTSLNTMYYWADTYLAWKIDHYFHLSNHQKTVVNRELVRLLGIYKVQEIPKYIGFLEEIKSRTHRVLNDDDLVWFRNQLGQYNTNLAQLLADNVTTFLLDLDEEQIHHFKKTLAEENQAWLEEHQKEDKRSLEERLAHQIEDLEKWIGRLTDEQKNEIAAMAQTESSYRFRLQRRLQSQQQFLEILGENHEKTAMRGALLNWYLHRDSSDSPEYLDYARQREQRSNYLVLMLSRTATEQQRTYFHKKLDDYLAQLKKIHPE